MLNADTDRDDRQRESGALTAWVARLESLRRRVVDTGPAIARIGAASAVILFVVVQLMGFDERLDGVEQRQTTVEERLDGMDARLARIEEGLATLLER